MISSIRSRGSYLGLFLAFALVVAACSSSDDPDTSTTSATDSGTASSTTAVASGDRVEINILGWEPGGPEYWRAAEAAFEASHPNIDLTFETVPFDRYFEVQGPIIAAQDGPDIMGNNGGLEMFERSDSYLTLNEVYPDRYAAAVDQLTTHSGTCEGYDTSNACYAVPFALQGNVLYYNRTILADAGLDPDAPPATWEEFDAACTAIQATGKTCLALGLTGPFPAFWDFPEIVRNYLTEDEMRLLLTGDMDWTSEKYINILQSLADITLNGWTNEDAISISMLPEGADLFAAGTAAFAGTIISDAVNWKSFGEALGSENLGVTRWPAINPDAPLVNKFSGIEAGAWGITAWSEHPEEAMQFLEFLASEENADIWVSLGEGFPLNKNVDPAALPDDPNFKIIQEIISDPTLHAGVMLSGVEIDALSRGWQQVQLGQITVPEWAQSMQDALLRSTKKVDG